MKNLKFLRFVPILIVFISCRGIKQSKFNPEQKIAATTLQQDFRLLKKILEANHPSLYWYTTKDSVDFYFNTAIESIQDSLTEQQFKNKVAWAISKIQCGHTAVRSSKEYNKYYLKKRTTQFPLSIKVWADSAVIVGNLNRRDSVLKRGTILTNINNYNNKTLLDSMFQLIGTDGYSINFKQQIISFNFPFYYRNTFGLDSQYHITYIDSSNRKKDTVIRNYVPRADTSARKQLATQPRLTKKEIRKYSKQAIRNMKIDTALRTAILNISTFSEGHLNGFFKKSFKTIHQKGIENVVIDLRENSGGNVMSSTRLTQYLIDKPFKIADTVAAINRSLTYRKYIKPWFLYWITMRFTGHREKDGRIHFRYFEQHKFKPKTKNHFNGNIYLVAGGFSFSAATLFIGALKGQQNVTVVGEETGGGYYGNTAMHLPVITLPKSKVRVVLPLYRMVIDKDRPKNGRGILPDVEVPPSSVAIKKGVDIKLEKVKSLIINKKQNG